MGDLLKEAIADAKAVRETALANAKMALEEAFTPRIKSMLSAKLKEDDEEFEDEEEFGGEEEPAIAAPEGGDEFGGGDEEEIAAGIDDIGGGEEEDEFGGEEEIPAEDVPLEEPEEDEVEENIIELNGQSFRLVPIQEDDEFGGEEEEENPFAGEEEEDELDLESVIKELEAELHEEEGDDDEDAVDESFPTDSSNIGSGDNAVNAADGSDEQDAESGVVVDDNDDDANALSASGKSVTEDTVYEISNSLLEQEDDDDDEDTVDEETDMGVVDDNDDDANALSASGKSVTEELGEYKDAVKFLKDKLHEVNILNAKLLYTNKLFREFILDNGQKMKVVETFDRAQTVREIKLVYSTLAESFQGGNVSKRKKAITESASKQSGSTKPQKKIISEEAAVANRFKQLAGLIKD
jgi:hypothetical protein